MKRKTLHFATTNKDKADEVKSILSPLGYDVTQVKLSIPELQGKGSMVTREKVKHAYSLLKKPVFVDDTSLEFDAWNGLPGVYAKDFFYGIGEKGLVKALSASGNMKARAVSRIGYHDGKSIRIFEGATSGRIVPRRGKLPPSSRFFFDPIFLPDGYDQTYAEMGMDEKNRISHRKKSLKKFMEFLRPSRR